MTTVYKTKTRAPKKSKQTQMDLTFPPAKKCRFIGFDQSLSCTGVVAVDYNFNIQEAFTIPTNVRSYPEARLDFIGMCVDSLLRKRGEHCYLVALERPAYGGSGRRDILAGVFWEIKRRVWVYNNDLNIIDVSISSWKKYITGNGRATKNLIEKSIQSRYGHHFNNENLYDAYGLLRFAAVQWRIEQRKERGE